MAIQPAPAAATVHEMVGTAVGDMVRSSGIYRSHETRNGHRGHGVELAADVVAEVMASASMVVYRDLAAAALGFADFTVAATHFFNMLKYGCRLAILRMESRHGRAGSSHVNRLPNEVDAALDADPAVQAARLAFAAAMPADPAAAAGQVAVMISTGCGIAIDQHCIFQGRSGQRQPYDDLANEVLYGVANDGAFQSGTNTLQGYLT